MPTIIESLAEFATDATFDGLPSGVVEESKRVVLDSVGCALAAVHAPKAQIGVNFGILLGAGGTEATIIGCAKRSSVFGAAFANAELINALDFDAVLPPGHVTPFVLPGALAVGEARRSTGARLLTAIAVGHEMTYRVGKAMDYVRDIRDGEMVYPPVFGYSAAVFGATAAVGRLLEFPTEKLAAALGIAACIAPVNSMWSSVQRAHATTVKYAHAGTLAHTALVAAFMADGGHTGDNLVLDDAEFGFPRFIGTSRWEPDRITDRLGSDWRFPTEMAYKLYPHCRVPAALLDALTDLVTEQDIRPAEIELIRAWGEPQGVMPVWANRDIANLNDAQSSLAHALAVAAHRVTPTRRWQDPEVVFSPSVLELMQKVEYHPHPDYQDVVSQTPASRPSRIEVTARGTVFTVDRLFPRGAPTSDSRTYITNGELEEKFRANASTLLTQADMNAFVDAVARLDGLENLETLVTRVALPHDAAGGSSDPKAALSDGGRHA